LNNWELAVDNLEIMGTQFHELLLITWRFIRFAHKNMENGNEWNAQQLQSEMDLSLGHTHYMAFWKFKDHQLWGCKSIVYLFSRTMDLMDIT
jgi:hypothetical protein